MLNRKKKVPQIVAMQYLYAYLYSDLQPSKSICYIILSVSKNSFPKYVVYLQNIQL